MWKLRTIQGSSISQEAIVWNSSHLKGALLFPLFQPQLCRLMRANRLTSPEFSLSSFLVVVLPPCCWKFDCFHHRSLFWSNRRAGFDLCKLSRIRIWEKAFVTVEICMWFVLCLNVNELQFNLHCDSLTGICIMLSEFVQPPLWSKVETGAVLFLEVA